MSPNLRFLNQDKIRVLITLAVFSITFFIYHFQIFKRFELVTYDYRFILKGARPADPRIAVIEISDDSVAKIGRWPWDRSWHATLIKVLKESGAKAVVFDVIFSEPSQPAQDAALAEAIADFKAVYLAEVLEEGSGTESGSSLLASLPIFLENAKGTGHINLEPDVDGVMRRIPLVKPLSGGLVPQLSFQVALDLMDAPMEKVKLHKDRLIIESSSGERFQIPLDQKQNFILNWVGRWQKSFLHFSYVDVITSYAAVQKGQKPVIDLKNFKDKICFVGTSAAGLFDIRPTPLEPAYPAVGVNLTVLNNLLERKFIYPANYFHNLGILLFLILLLFKITKLKSYFKTAVWIVALVAGYAFLAVTLFIFFDVWIQMIYPFILILATYFSITLYSQLSVAIERTRLLKLATRDSLTGLYNIGHFRLLLGAELATLAMHKEKKISILMSDVDNFKKTNDTYGHVTGDTVLKEVASEIKSNCRALDVAARYGGEEFIVMFPGASAQEAFKIAEKLRKAVSEKIFFHETGNFSTTISLGITQINSSDKNIEDIVARADKALYEAKQTGKNKTVLSSS